MSNWYLLAVLLFAASPAMAQEQTDVELRNLNGSIAAVTEATYTHPKYIAYACILRSQPQPKYRTVRTTHITDGKGNQPTRSYFNKDNQLIYTSYTRFDENNNIAEVVQNGSDGTPLGRFSYTYDASGCLVQTDFYDGNNKLTRTIRIDKEYFKDKSTLFFDDKGMAYEKDSYSESDSLINKTTTAQYKYLGQGIDPVGNKTNAGKTILFEQKDKDGVLLLSTASAYDTRGNLISRIVYDKDGTFKSGTYYRYSKYDANGNWHKVTYWTIDDEMDLTTPHYAVQYREVKYRS